MRVGVPEPARDLIEGQLESRIGERADLPAVGADDVVVMIPARPCRLEAGDSVAEIDPGHESLRGQELEDAIDARDPDRPPLHAEPVEDLLRCQAAVLAAEQLDDRSAGAAAPVAPRAQHRKGRLRPVRHPPDDSRCGC